jgi:hypothetical protein
MIWLIEQERFVRMTVWGSLLARYLFAQAGCGFKKKVDFSCNVKKKWVKNDDNLIMSRYTAREMRKGRNEPRHLF